jgi:hypothetical protein
MANNMSRDEFIKSAAKLGYCTKKEAEAYCNKYREETYTDDDYIEVCRFVDAHRPKYTGTRLAGGGTTSKRYFLEDE